MTNRLLTIFPGEVEFGGGPPNVPAVTYVDLGASWDVSPNIRLRVGVNNVADEQPPLYSPNVQSGTEPSLYDVVGRRAFGQIELKF
jgi:outer membrane receptor protein involved in Fe transport